MKLESITVRIVTGTSLRSAIVRNAIVQAFPEDGPPFACGFAIIGRKSKLEDANICEHRISSDNLIATPPIRVQRRPASFCGGLNFSNQHHNSEINFCSNGKSKPAGSNFKMRELAPNHSFLPPSLPTASLPFPTNLVLGGAKRDGCFLDGWSVASHPMRW